MTKIKERARAYAMTRNQNTYAYDGYIKGAQDQHEIDKQHMLQLADACEHDMQLMVDKACEWLRTELGFDDERREDFVYNLRKAMKGE